MQSYGLRNIKTLMRKVGLLFGNVSKAITRYGHDISVMIIFFVLSISIPYLSCGQHNFYISANGSNMWGGTREHPFATFERAQMAVRNVLLRKGSGYGVTVWVFGGTYCFTKTFSLDSLDSGTENAPVIYRSMPGEKVYLVGGDAISPSAFEPIKDPAVLQKITTHNQAGKYVVRADLKKLGITDYGELKQYGFSVPVVPAPMELFFNGRPMQLARYPNVYEITMGAVVDPGSIPRSGDTSNRGGIFKYTDLHESLWAGIKDVWLQGTFHWGYADDVIRVDSIDTVRHEIRLASPDLYGLASDGKPYQHYIALNVLQELDNPGEYYIDRDSEFLYFWPPEKMQEAEIFVSMLAHPLVSLLNASHIIMRGFTLEYGRGLGIYMEGGGHNLIAGCVIRDMGTAGILIGQGSEPVRGSSGLYTNYKGVPVSGKIGDLITHLYNDKAWDRDAGVCQKVRSCDIYYTGSGGIFLGGGDKRALIPGHCSVMNCRIHDYNRRNKFLYAGIDVNGVGDTVAHNEIYNSNYQGIYVISGNNNIFEYNDIHDVAMNSDDISPFYIGGDPSDRGNIVRYNYFHNIGKEDRLVMGVYLDDGACGTTVFGNVFYKTGTYGTVYSNSGSENIVKNNIFISSYGPAIHLKSEWYDFAKEAVQSYFGSNGLYRNRLTKTVDIYKPPYSTAYPKLKHFLDLLPDGKTYAGMRPAGNVMEWNVIYDCPASLRLTAPYARFDSLNNFITNEDPGFINAEQQDFQLKDNSIVYKILKGFKRIPFDKIGLERDQYRDF